MCSEVTAITLLPKVQESWVAKINLVTDSYAANPNCQLQAKNDLEAVGQWLLEYQHKKNTYVSYRREAMRFLMWCSYERGVTLAQLKKEDFEGYFRFIQKPPKRWCWQQDKKKTNNTALPEWRTFKGSLSPVAFLKVIRVLNSMLNYLVDAEYIHANPIKLIKKYSKLAINYEEYRYQVWERMLEDDEWNAVQDALRTLPEKTKQQRETKFNTQFLFVLLYLLGLRINEVATHTWSCFRQKDGKWLFFVRGKGDKLQHLSVNDQLLEFIQAYRKYLGKTPLPNPDEAEGLIFSTNTNKPLQVNQLYKLVKTVGEIAALQFPHEPKKQQKLLKLSPHWMRHLLASHLDKAGVAVTMIQSILRHSSLQTTNIYVHPENNERYNAMQKINFHNDSLALSKAPVYIGYEFKMKLTKGPVSKVLGVSRIIQTIETHAFKGLDWVRVGEDTEKLLEKIRQQGIVCTEVELVYQVRAKEVVDAPHVWEEALKRQASIWLFVCIVKSTGIEA
jgi:site-specific recombinase XerD